MVYVFQRHPLRGRFVPLSRYELIHSFLIYSHRYNLSLIGLSCLINLVLVCAQSSLIHPVCALQWWWRHREPPCEQWLIFSHRHAATTSFIDGTGIKLHFRGNYPSYDLIILIAN